jgi:hypothetical protein
MKTTMVPAQVTTVEDKIAGSMSMQQLMLLISPVFLGAAMYILLPPFMHFSLYKSVLFGLVAIVFCLLAVRIKGNLILNWITIIGRYNGRSRYYVFNKNDLYLRSGAENISKQDRSKPKAEAIKLQPKLPHLPLPQMIQLQSALSDPRRKLNFKTDKKGGLNVYITEIQ